MKNICESELKEILKDCADLDKIERLHFKILRSTPASEREPLLYILDNAEEEIRKKIDNEMLW